MLVYKAVCSGNWSRAVVCSYGVTHSACMWVPVFMWACEAARRPGGPEPGTGQVSV